MGCWIVIAFSAVFSHRQQLPGPIHNHRTHRNIARCPSGGGEGDRPFHPVLMHLQ
jgi:hypothetical protein